MKALPPFSITPAIDKYKSRMNAINNSLSGIVDSAMVSFFMISALLKKYDLSTAQRSDKAMPLVSIIVRELQFIDIFNQKLSHLTDLQESLLQSVHTFTHATNRNVDNANFIFRLNHLQALTAQHDFSTSVNNLRNYTQALQAETKTTQPLISLKKLKQNEEEISSVASELDALAWERHAESPIDSAIVNHMLLISESYTMESERYVLQWYANNLQGSADELMRLYKQKQFYVTEEKAELF